MRTIGRIDLFLVAALLLGLPVILMTFPFGGRLMGNADSILHLHRIITNVNSLHEGILWPRWYPNLFLGYGYPLGNYYPPFVSMIGAVMALAGIRVVTALLLTQAIALLIAPAGAYLFARQFSGRPAALLASVVYLYTPFLFFQLYHIGNLPQLFGVSLMPWCFWAIARCAAAPGAGRALLIAPLLAMVILSHQLVAAYTLPAAGLYTILASWAASDGRRLDQPKRIHRLYGRGMPRPYQGIGRIINTLFTSHNLRRYVWTNAGYWLGFLLTAIYWLPAALEVDYIHPIEMTTGMGNAIESNFVLLRDLLGPARAVDHSALIPIFRLSVGYPQLAIVAGSLILLILRRRSLTRWQMAHIVVGAAAIIILIYLMTYRSLWLWQGLPGIELIQQSWRLMGLLYVLLIPLAALVFDVLLRRTSSWLAPVLLAGVFAAALPVSFPHSDNFFDPGAATLAANIDYEAATGNYGTVVFGEYLPVWVDSVDGLDACRACYTDWNWRIYPEQERLPDDVTVEMAGGAPEHGTAFVIDSPQAFDFILHQLYFPGWVAELDGQPVTINTTSPGGLMSVAIPAGEYSLTMWYAGTSAQHNAGRVSLFAALVLVGLAMVAVRQRKSSDQVDSPHIADQAPVLIAVACAGIMISIALVSAIYIQPDTGLFRAEAPVDAPLHMQNPANFVFVDESGEAQLELLGYDLNSGGEAGYGDWLYVDLYWRVLRPQAAGWNVRVSLADRVYGLPWVYHDTPHPGIIPMTAWPLDRYVYDRHILEVDANIPPYAGNLLVQVYSAERGAELTTQAGESKPLLNDLRVDEAGSHTLPEDAARIKVDFGDLMTLTAYTMARNGDQLQLGLYWEVNEATDVDYRLFIHFLQDGEFLEAADRRPLDVYPANLWREGQKLSASYALDIPPDADAVLIGVYDPVMSQRLAARGSGVTIRDEGLLLGLAR